MSDIPKVPFPPGGLRIEISAMLTGQKRAVRIGDTLHVSQAMHDLMKGATHEELMHLFEHLEFLDISQFNVMQPMPPIMNFEEPKLSLPFEC